MFKNEVRDGPDRLTWPLTADYRARVIAELKNGRHFPAMEAPAELVGRIVDPEPCGTSRIDWLTDARYENHTAGAVESF